MVEPLTSSVKRPRLHWDVIMISESAALIVRDVAKQESFMTVITSPWGVSEPPSPDVSASHEIRNRTAIKPHTVVLRFISV